MTTSKMLSPMSFTIDNPVDNPAGNTPYVDDCMGHPSTSGDRREVQSFEYKDDIPFGDNTAIIDGDPTQEY